MNPNNMKSILTLAIITLPGAASVNAQILTSRLQSNDGPQLLSACAKHLDRRRK